MPIYAYRCTNCGHAQDMLRKISDPPLNVCPACGAATFVKQVTAAGFQLKGSGWYVTDFRDGKKAAKPADAGAGAAAETNGAGGGETAPVNGDGAKAEPAKPADPAVPAAGKKSDAAAAPDASPAPAPAAPDKGKA